MKLDKEEKDLRQTQVNEEPYALDYALGFREHVVPNYRACTQPISALSVFSVSRNAAEGVYILF